MRLNHSFTVPVGIDDAWSMLLDIEQVAPCLPDTALETVAGDDFAGSVKVRLGPVPLKYQGRASFVEKDEAAHRATIDAQGRESRGGMVSAKVTAALFAEGTSSTRVDVMTDLNITGRPAQFGRGVIVDVGKKLIDEFAYNLAAQLSQEDKSAVPARAREPAEEAAPAVAATAATVPSEPVSAPPVPAEVIPASPALVRRVAPIAAAVAALIALFVLGRRRHHS